MNASPDEALLIGAEGIRRAHRVERVEFERSDIEWEPFYHYGDEKWGVQNVGQDTAYEVELLATFDGGWLSHTAKAIRSRESVDIDIHDLTEEARAEATERFERLLASNVVTTGAAEIEIGYRITWRSKGERWFNTVHPAEAVRVDGE